MSTPRWRRLQLGARLFAAMGLVVLAGAATLLTVAILAAPAIFHGHLHATLGDIPPPTQAHVDEAFATAILLSLAVAVAVAVLAALTVTWLVTRRIVVPTADLAAATTRLAAGQYDTRVPDPNLGPEFAALADGINTMASRLAGTESIRRRLLADLAHELRTPIASIDATVEAVADGVLPANETTWATLTDQTRRLSRLVADLAAVSAAEERALATNRRAHRLTRLTTTAVAAARARYTAKGVQLELVGTAPDTDVMVDNDRMAEVLAVLLDNALRHTPPGGVVTVTVDQARHLGQPLARLTVTDTGEGFDPAEASALFERFYRTDAARARQHGGSGIGLTIARAIINAHQGSIQAHSDGPGQGATVTVLLPLAD
jgi:signal transduction histidine kinase